MRHESAPLSETEGSVRSERVRVKRFGAAGSMFFKRFIREACKAIRPVGDRGIDVTLRGQFR